MATILSDSSTPAPTLPFPLFKVSQKVNRYVLYDISIITWLRKNHNILGVLIGTLPQIPQQNVFLGLPVELRSEEARLIIEKGLAYVVDDREWHARDLASKTSFQIDAIKADVQKEGMRIAREFEARKQIRALKALKKKEEKENLTVGQRQRASTSHREDEGTEESLFGEPLTRETTATPSPSPSQIVEADINPWTLTPTTSYSSLSLPPKAGSGKDLPDVAPSSYALFKHLHGLGYFLSPGIRFGCQFSVYPGDPLRFHSHFLTMSADWDEEINLLDLIGGGRLGTGVKKGWLIGGVEPKPADSEASKGSAEGVAERSDDDTQVRTFCIEWGGM